MDASGQPRRPRALFVLGGVAALVALVVGAALVAPRGQAPSPGATEPAASVSPGPTAAATAAPIAVPPDRDRIWVYFARDQLPPAGTFIGGVFDDRSAESRIGSRISELRRASADEVPRGATNPIALLGTVQQTPQGTQGLFEMSVRVEGDLARIEFGPRHFDRIHGSATIGAMLQQLVYTITEEPGIRRVLLAERGRGELVIDNMAVIKDPLTREDVFEYAFKGSEVTSIENPGMDVAQEVTAWMATNGLLSNGQLYTAGRVSVDVREIAPPVEAPPPANAPVRRLDPTFRADLTPVTKACTDPRCVGGTWRIALTLPSQSLPSQQPTVMVDLIGGPIRGVDGQVVSPSCGGGASACPPFTLIAIYLDDARPWRVSVEPTGTGTARINVDVGGRPSLVNRNIAVYGLEPGDPVPRTFTVTGAARVFEANVAWRLRDASGEQVAQGHATASVGTSPVWGTFEAKVEVPSRVTGRVTLEVFWGSPKDGSDQDVVRIPLSVR